MISFRIPVRFDDTFIFKEIENVLTELELERDRSERESLNFQRYDDSSLDQLWQTLVKHTRLNGGQFLDRNGMERGT